jgi:hypothetical protein
MTHSVTNDRHHDLRSRAFDDLRRFEVVMEGQLRNRV